MLDIRAQVSQMLRVEEDHLFEVELEDIAVTPSVHEKIDKAVSEGWTKMPGGDTAMTDWRQHAVVPCKTFWIEGTRELVFYLLLGSQPRIVVVPENGWKIRDDVSIN